jgi:predicted acetyltransferase
MRFRTGDPADIPALAALWSHAFPDERSTADRIRSLESGGPHGGLETTLLADTGTGLAGACRLLPFRQVLTGSDMSMMGLAAVAVAPAARRRGVGAELCRRAMEEGVRRGHAVSVLYPFRPEFYHRLGWGLVGSLERFRFAPESLVAEGDPEVEPGCAGDEAGVAACYDRVASISNGLIRRDAFLWRKHLEAPSTHLFVARSESGVGGYVLAGYGKRRPGGLRTLEIRELVAESEGVYARLLAWMSAQQDAWRRVRYDAAPDEHFALRLSDPRPPGYRPARRLWAESAHVLRGPMLRLLDVRAALAGRARWGSAAAFAFTLEVEDAELPGNRGPFRLEFDGSRVHPGSGVPAVASLRLGPAVLAQVWAGEIGVATAVGMGLAQASGDVGVLGALFRPERAFRLLDEF